MKKDYYLIIDTETTMSEKVADFGAVVVDRKGNIQTQCGVLVNGVFGIDALFYINGEKENSLWSKQGKDRRFDKYNATFNGETKTIIFPNADIEEGFYENHGLEPDEQTKECQYMSIGEIDDTLSVKEWLRKTHKRLHEEPGFMDNIPSKCYY